MTPSNVGGVYVSRRGWQPTVVGVNEIGELIWDFVVKQSWHQKMFPVPYGGDFMTEWMWKSLQEKGMEWDSND